MIVPDFGTSFSGLASVRKLTHNELFHAKRFMIAAEYEAIKLYMQLAESADTKLAIEVLKDIADEVEEEIEKAKDRLKSNDCDKSYHRK